jgi:hypothetical protein
MENGGSDNIVVNAINDVIKIDKSSTPLVEVRDLRVWFAGRRDFLGRPETIHKSGRWSEF